jgi:NHLM bacteriocin system ABC transporter peptidase/ATP-binding protein
MEAVECGAAALAIVLGHHGRFVPLEVLRVACGVSRDGSKAGNIVKAARTFGLEAKGFKKEPSELAALEPPYIVFWNFNHFLVVEGFGKGQVFLNDPASGPRVVSEQEFDESFTGVVLVLKPGPSFQKGGQPPSLAGSLARRLPGIRLALAFVVLAGLLLVGPGLVIPTFGRVLVDYLLIGGATHWLKPLLLAMGLTAALRATLMYLQKKYLGRLETQLAVGMASKFLWHTLRLPVEFFHQRDAGDLVSRASANDRVARLLSGDLATSVVNALMVVFYALLMVTYDPLLCGVGVAMASMNLIAMRTISRRRTDQSRKLIQDSGKLWGIAAGGLATIETLKATGAEGDFFARWAGHHAKVANGEQHLGASTQFLDSVPSLLTAATHVAILGVGALRVMDGHLSMGLLVAFQSLMGSFLQPVNEMVRLGGTLQEIEGDLARLDDVHNYAQDPSFAGKPAGNATDTDVRLGGQVELHDLTFGYSKLEPPLVENLSLVIKPGSHVALVGGSGSGKSTLAKVVAGLYQPWAGQVLFDGKDRAEIPRAILNNSVAIVDQDISLFAGTINENITLWDSTIAEASVVRAARDAEIHEEVAARPGSYEGQVEEGGRNFSGGQRQRLEIARALVGNPSVLVLDEATSALDPRSEEAITKHLKRRGCTCLIIAHRLSTIRDCDEILVLERGKVVQRGTHEEMSKVEGPYVELLRTT